MATGPKNTLAENYDQAIKCSICLGSMIRTDAEPKVLQCGHSLCTVCLSQLQSGPMEKYKCSNPTCGRELFSMVKCVECRELSMVDTIGTNISLVHLHDCAKTLLREVMVAKVQLRSIASNTEEGDEKNESAEAVIAELESRVKEDLQSEYDEREAKLKTEYDEKLETAENIIRLDAAETASRDYRMIMEEQLRLIKEDADRNLLAAVSADSDATESILIAKAVAASLEGTMAQEPSVESLNDAGYACASVSESKTIPKPVHTTRLRIPLSSRTKWQEKYGGSVLDSAAAANFAELQNLLQMKEQAALAKISDYERYVIENEAAIRCQERVRIRAEETRQAQRQIADIKDHCASEIQKISTEVKAAKEAAVKSREEEICQLKRLVQQHEAEKSKSSEELSNTSNEVTAARQELLTIGAENVRLREEVFSVTEQLQLRRSTEISGTRFGKGRGHRPLVLGSTPTVGKGVDTESRNEDSRRLQKHNDELSSALSAERRNCDQLRSEITDLKKLVQRRENEAAGALAEGRRLQQEYNQLERTLQNIRQNYEREVQYKVERGVERMRNQCIRCLEYNHQRDQCPYAESLGEFRCSRCLGWGHIRKECHNLPFCFTCQKRHPAPFCKRDAFQL